MILKTQIREIMNPTQLTLEMQNLIAKEAQADKLLRL
ncbi:hypothetical protein SDC9_169796 [bioreactor metagenome]|uniref:Uncharacterized protein n=1 Tax=bioreactor metagenome TaxID=1076179 RepID=A0A645GF55_9ZZZZ